MSFRAGDKVVCINDSPIPNASGGCAYGTGLEKGKVYEVTGTRSAVYNPITPEDEVRLEGVDSGTKLACRFIHYKGEHKAPEPYCNQASNLDRASKKPVVDWTKPVQLRTGEPFTVLTTQHRNPRHPVLGYVGSSNTLCYRRMDGRCSDDPNIETPSDVINVPVKHRRLLAVSFAQRLSYAFKDYESALEFINHDPESSLKWAIIPIEFEDGERR